MIYMYAGYLIIMNVLEFTLMAADKYRAVHKKWRIPEKVLLLLAVLGGGLGGWLAMLLVCHKTKRWYFVLLMPLMTLIYGILTWVLVSLEII